jgi:small subunit ribosomal protein S16
MVRIRLRRMGAKKSPFYRIVVADKRSPRDGRFIESIGTYNPHTQPETVELQMERAAYWLSSGAQPSDGVIRILQRVNLIDATGNPVPYAPAETPAVEAAA